MSTTNSPEESRLSEKAHVAKSPYRLFLFVALVALALFGVTFIHYKVKTTLKTPDQVLVEDFQTPMDRDLLAPLQLIEQNGAVTYLDNKVIKPLLDDVTTMTYAVDGVEITDQQFIGTPELAQIINDCARILKIPRPRVFIAKRQGLNAFTTNFKDPIIVLHSGLLRCYTDPAELRFIIGHEMGHIKCQHVRWLTVLRLGLKSLPTGVSQAALLPLLMWAREAEYSADNAGLICTQNLQVSEDALVRLILELNDSRVGKLNVDEYLKQRTSHELSKASDVAYLCMQFMNEHPFIPERISHLREYAKSQRYHDLWN